MLPHIRQEELMGRSTAHWNTLGLPHRPVDGGTHFLYPHYPLKKDGYHLFRTGVGLEQAAGDRRIPIQAQSGCSKHLTIGITFCQITFCISECCRSRRIEPRCGRPGSCMEDAVEGVDYDVERSTKFGRPQRPRSCVGRKQSPRCPIASICTGTIRAHGIHADDFTEWYVVE